MMASTTPMVVDEPVDVPTFSDDHGDHGGQHQDQVEVGICKVYSGYVKVGQ